MPTATLTPHQIRPVRFIALEEVGDWRLKVYGITQPGREARPALVEAAVAAASVALPRPAVADERPGVGFVIAHDAATVCCVGVYWWQASNELHQRVFTSPLERPQALVPELDPAAGCVWELYVIDFERRAWLRHVLANPAGPDLARYLDRRLDADV